MDYIRLKNETLNEKKNILRELNQLLFFDKLNRNCLQDNVCEKREIDCLRNIFSKYVSKSKNLGFAELSLRKQYFFRLYFVIWMNSFNRNKKRCE